MITAVVPMKPLALAKRRLAATLPRRERRALVRTMLYDVLTALLRCPQVARTFVVTSDLEVIELAARCGAGHIPETAPAGFNQAVAAASRYLEDIGAGSMLVVPGDVPLVTAAEIGELASLSRPCGMAIVPAHDRDGTNALLLSPPGAVAPSFGPGSFERHFAAGHKAGLAPAISLLKGLRRDIDEARDLQILMRKTGGRPEYGFLRQALAHVGTDAGQIVERERA